MKTATVVAGGRFSDLRWNPGQVERHRQDIIRRAVTESRMRSRHGFGIQRAKNEFVQGMASFRDGWFFDTFTVAAGAAFPQATLMFATPQSGSKLLNSTNLTGQGGQLPAGTTLQVNRIRVEISNPTTQTDFANIMFERDVRVQGESGSDLPGDAQLFPRRIRYSHFLCGASWHGSYGNLGADLDQQRNAVAERDL